MIPKETHAFVVLSDLAGTDQAIATLAAKAQIPIPGAATVFKMATGLGNTIDKEGSIAILYFERPGEVQEEEETESTEELTPDTNEEVEEIIATEEDDEGSPGEDDENVAGDETSSKQTFPVNTVFLLPVSDFEKFLSTFEKSEKIGDSLYKVEVDSGAMFLAPKNGYVVLASETSRESFDLVLAAKSDVNEELKPWKDWIDQQILYGFLTHYCFEKIQDGGHGKFNVGVGTDGFKMERTKESGAEPDENASGKTEPSQEESVPETGPSPADVNFAAAGVNLNESGVIRITLRVSFKPDSWLPQQYSTIAPLGDNLLASLPQGPFVLAGNGDFSTVMAKWFGVIQATSSESADGEEKIGEFLPNRCFFIGPPQKGQTALENICIINRTTGSKDAFDCVKKDTEAVQNWSQGILQSVNRFFNGNDSDEEEEGSEEQDKNKKDYASLCKVLTREATIENYKSLIVTYDLSKAFKKAEEDMNGIGGALMESTFENVYGNNFKIDEYNIQVKEKRILSTYCRDPEIRKQLIEIAKTQTGGLTDDERIQKVLSQFPAEAQWKYLWSPHGTTQYLKWYFEVVMLPAIESYVPFDTFPEFPESSPVGVAGIASGGLFEWTVVIPPDTLRNSFQYWMQLQLFFRQFQENETI